MKENEQGITNMDRARFTNKYKVNKTTGCWEWTAALDTAGYGSFFYKGGMKRASRVSYLLYKGDVHGKHVLHTCDNRKCVNPDHLFLGTHTDNMRDMASKGRGKYPNNTGNKHTVGEANGSSKLREYDVKAILLIAKYGVLSHLDIAKEFKVSRASVSSIVRRESWTHLKEEW